MNVHTSAHTMSFPDHDFSFLAKCREALEDAGRDTDRARFFLRKKAESNKELMEKIFEIGLQQSISMAVRSERRSIVEIVPAFPPTSAARQAEIARQKGLYRSRQQIRMLKERLLNEPLPGSARRLREATYEELIVAGSFYLKQGASMMSRGAFYNAVALRVKGNGAVVGAVLKEAELVKIEEETRMAIA